MILEAPPWMDLSPATGETERPHSWTTIKTWSRDTLSELLTGRGRDRRFVGTAHVPHVWKSMILVARKPAGGLKRK
jgi:hypothetical protein